jgi:hypothetical protein
MTKRTSERQYLSIDRCSSCGALSVSLDSPKGGTRISPGRCHGSHGYGVCFIHWELSATDLRELSELFANAAEDTEREPTLDEEVTT